MTKVAYDPSVSDRKIYPWDVHNPASYVRERDADRLASIDKALYPYWKDLSAKDFYFASQWYKDTNAVLIYVVPAVYYLRFNKHYEDSLPVDSILPNYLVEIFDAIYETQDREIKYVEVDLQQRGLIHSSKFQDYINNNFKDDDTYAEFITNGSVRI